jgi:hypothetical protein
VIAGMNWQELYSFASKQALLGLCFEGIERLGKEYPAKRKQQEEEIKSKEPETKNQGIEEQE